PSHRARRAAGRISLRAISRRGTSCGVALLQFADQLVLPGALRPQREPQLLGALVVEVAVRLPGEADAAVGLGVLLRRVVEGLRRGDARGGGGQRELARA